MDFLSTGNIKVQSKVKNFDCVVLSPENLETIAHNLGKILPVELVITQDDRLIGLDVFNGDWLSTGYIGDYLLIDENGVVFFVNGMTAKEMFNITGN